MQEQDPTPAQTEDIDLDFTPANEGNAEPPLVDTPPLVDGVPVVNQVPTNDGVRRSHRVCTQAKPLYTPAMTRKKYSFATTILGARMLGNEAYEYNQVVSYNFMQQLSVKAALREWGHEVRVAGEKETLQLHWRETFTPKRMSELTNDKRPKVLQSHMFAVRKCTGETKARMVAGGNLQRGHVTKEESSSPTVSTKSVLLTLIVDALEEQDITIIDIPNAFIQTQVQDAKDRVIIRIAGVIVNWLVKAAPKVYAKYVAVNSRGEKSLLVECFNAIYGTMVAGLLYYHKFSRSLEKRGLVMNPYDPCVWNKTNKGKQITICFCVDDCKISHVSKKVVDYNVAWLREEYESIFTDGTGKMNVARGNVHIYLGMMLVFTTPKLVKVTMMGPRGAHCTASTSTAGPLQDGSCSQI